MIMTKLALSNDASIPSRAPHSAKKLFSGSAAIFRLVTLLIYFYLSLIMNEKSSVFVFLLHLIIFPVPVCADRERAEHYFHFTERKTMWNWKASAIFPFPRSWTWLSAPLSALRRAVNARVCLSVPRIMNGRDITLISRSYSLPNVLDL